MLPISKKSVTEENIRQMLKKPVVMMPQFGNLTDEQVVSLISYLKGL
jgi:cytochrome c1